MCKIDAPEGVLTGNKDCWQEYPCIVAYNADYALIAENEEGGMLVNKEGETVAKGKPLDIGQSGIYNITGVDFYVSVHDKWYEWNKFWKAKYPEYFKGQWEPEK